MMTVFSPGHFVISFLSSKIIPRQPKKSMFCQKLSRIFNKDQLSPCQNSVASRNLTVMAILPTPLSLETVLNPCW